MEKKDIQDKIKEAKAKFQDDKAKSVESTESKPKPLGGGTSTPKTSTKDYQSNSLNSGIEGTKKKKNFLSYFLFAAGFIALGMFISFISAIAIKKTSGEQFCSSCHSMKPMAEAYRNSVHGGFGESGVVAQCADCHLPHDTLLGYLIQKGKSGMWDLWVESTRDTDKIDWEEKREHKRDFVYDTGCLHCHENLLKATKLKSKPFIAHKAYFANKLKVKDDGEWKKAQCVDCHKYVGHYQLEKHLEKAKNEALELNENE